MSDYILYSAFIKQNSPFGKIVQTNISLKDFVSNIKIVLNNPPTDKFRFTGAQSSIWLNFYKTLL